MTRNHVGDEHGHGQSDLRKQSHLSARGHSLIAALHTTLGSVYLPRDTEGPNVLMQDGIAGLSLKSLRLSCWVVKAA